MEDLLIIKNHFAYMLRVDIDEENSLEIFQEWKEKYSCTHYIVGKETAPSGKIHLQCIVWFIQKLTSNGKSIARNWWLKHCSNTKQPIAFTSAKKVVNLAKYSKKDKNFVTNLSQEQLDLIGQWKKNDTKRWKELLHEKCENICKYLRVNPAEFPEYCEVLYEDSYIMKETYASQSYFLDNVLCLYKENNKRPRRNDLIHLMWVYNIITNQDLIQRLNILK